MEHQQGHPSRHSDRTCSAGRPRRENMLPPHNGSPFWTRFTKYRALDTQAANGPSLSSNPFTGGPVCTVISPGTSEVAQSVPSPRLLVTSP